MRLLRANEGNVASSGHPLRDALWRVDGRQTRRGHEPDIRERFWMRGENEQRAIGHIQVSKNGPAWCMANKLGVRHLTAKVGFGCGWRWGWGRDMPRIQQGWRYVGLRILRGQMGIKEYSRGGIVDRRKQERKEVH